ncbi:F-box/LRR-repeat protein 2-like isoform X2 [Odontomachus brunneus]|uniref:F-box/LRR-repeat protein 2-like isoform X2 n=1 Tax=Odontomachus brunneus TaxID=486640 RepID=UPI0013F27FED|nr:F-box/LRR-repeat protein 2-like isoform X2 [Odontomachus brunneus]
MKEIQVYDFQKVSINILNDDCLKHIFKYLPIIDKMRIERVCKRWKILSQDSWYTMKEIDTSWTYELPDFGKCLSYLPAQTMRTLILRCCWNIDDIIFSQGLAKLENLEHLEITCSTVGNEIMRTINKYCKKLKILQIHQYKMFPQKAAASEFTNLINLETLKMTYFPFLPHHFTEIAMNCQQIISLDISGSSVCDDTALRTIATLPKLEYLNISFVLGITDNGLKNLKNLKGLECSGCENITDNGICEILVSSPQLQLLDLSFCSRITNNIFKVAKVIRDNEPSKMVLKIYISGTQIVVTDEYKVHPAIQLITFGKLPVTYMPLRHFKKQCAFYRNWREQTRMREAILKKSTCGYPFDQTCWCNYQ